MNIKLSIQALINKNVIISSCLVIYYFQAISQTGQSLTIEECQKLAIDNYPLIKQREILDNTKEYSLDNAVKGYLPQINFSSQITYQSDVTKIPFSIPDLNIPSPSKDQYKAYIEIAQSLTESKIIKQQSEVIVGNTDVEQQKLTIDLYALKERVNQMYFSILLIKAQMDQVGYLKKDIQTGIDKTNAAIDNGTALKSSADILKAELLKSDQRTIELQANLKGYEQTLSLFIHQNIDEHTMFITPPAQEPSTQINRPELKLFDFQHTAIDAQQSLIDLRKTPKIGLFLQGGYGKPALNLLNNKFGFYYIGGIRLNWSLSGLYTSGNDKQILTLNQHQLDIQKETFLLNTNLAMAQEESEINKLHDLMVVDDQIIGLYENILKTYEAQLQNGTITTNDYLIHLNAVDQARQNLILHHIQWLMAQYAYKTTSGN